MYICMKSQEEQVRWATNHSESPRPCRASRFRGVSDGELHSLGRSVSKTAGEEGHLHLKVGANYFSIIVMGIHT
jgi:hypothetical protein